MYYRTDPNLILTYNRHSRINESTVGLYRSDFRSVQVFHTFRIVFMKDEGFLYEFQAIRLSLNTCVLKVILGIYLL